METEVSEDGSAGEECTAHAGEEMPVRPIGWAVRLRHVIGLLYHLTVDLKQKRKCRLNINLFSSIISLCYILSFSYLVH